MSYSTFGTASSIFAAEGIGSILESSAYTGALAYRTYDAYDTLPVGTNGWSGSYFISNGDPNSASASGSSMSGSYTDGGSAVSVSGGNIATRGIKRLYRLLTGWHFEGRDAINAPY